MPVSATARATCTVLAPGAHRHASLSRKFHRVAQQIHQDLPQLVLIGEQRREVSLDRFRQAKALALDRRLHRAQAGIDELLHLNIDRMDLHPSGLDFGEVEDVVDQRQEMLSADQDLPKILVFARGQDVLRAPHHQPGKTDNGVHRGPELVGHVGQELGLGLGGGFGRFFRLL